MESPGESMVLFVLTSLPIVEDSTVLFHTPVGFVFFLFT